MKYAQDLKMSSPLIETETDVLVEEETGLGDGSELIVYNDDYNTFDWVIKCFVDVIGHTEEQAEQLSLIVHFKGKASVKEGSFRELKPFKDALIDRGLSAVIEKIGEEA